MDEYWLYYYCCGLLFLLMHHTTHYPLSLSVYNVLLCVCFPRNENREKNRDMDNVCKIGIFYGTILQSDMPTAEGVASSSGQEMRM